MNKISLQDTDAEAYVNMLISSKTPHKVIYTNSSVEIVMDNKSVIFTKNQLSPQELGFIGMAKSEIIEASERLKIPERKPRFYRIYNCKHIPEKAIEIDINSAYWETAFRDGLLSKRIYDRGNAVKKEVRLIAFGAAAVTKRVFIFDGNTYHNSEEIKNEFGRKAFFYVASEVSNCLSEICDQIPGKAFLYWVDAIICAPEYADFVCKCLFNEGWTFKRKYLTECKIAENEKYREFICTDEATGKEKSFKQWRCNTGGKNEGLIKKINIFLGR